MYEGEVAKIQDIYKTYFQSKNQFELTKEKSTKDDLSKFIGNLQNNINADYKT